MPSYYSGHISGQNDPLYADGRELWEWRLSSLQLNKAFSTSETLRGQPSANSHGYGVEMITDNLPPSEVRTYSADCISRNMLEELRTCALSRNSVITLTDRLGFTFTGRFSGLSIAENGSNTEASAFYSASITLRSIENEDNTTVKNNITLSD